MKFLLGGGIIMCIGSIILLSANLHTLKVEREGEVVAMRIEEMPKSCYGARTRYNVVYSYQGKLYEKATRGNFCKEHFVGQRIFMRYLEGSDTILRPTESALMNLVAFAFLALLGLSISIIAWRKYP